LYRLLLVTMLSAALFGCSHYFDLNSDDFQRGSASREAFGLDNYECSVQASIAQTRAGGGDPVGVYNDAYDHCMRAHGYAPKGMGIF
jgi:hypothetical protein